MPPALGYSTAEIEADGSFLFPLVPVGEYTLTRLTPLASPPDLVSPTGEISKPVGRAFSVEAIFQSGAELRTPLKITVKENECIGLGNLDSAALESSQTVSDSPLSDAKPRPGTIVVVDQNDVQNGMALTCKPAQRNFG